MNKSVIVAILLFGIAAQCEAGKPAISKVAPFENKVTYPLLQKITSQTVTVIAPLSPQTGTFTVPVVVPLSPLTDTFKIPAVAPLVKVEPVVGISVVQAVKPVAGVSSNVLDTAANVTISGNSPLSSVRIKAEDANKKFNAAEHQARADEYLRELNLAVERRKLLEKRKKYQKTR